MRAERRAAACRMFLIALPQGVDIRTALKVSVGITPTDDSHKYTVCE